MTMIEESKMNDTSWDTKLECSDDTQSLSHDQFVERYTILAAQEMIAAKKGKIPIKEFCEILIDSVTVNILRHRNDSECSFNLGKVDVIMTRNIFTQLEKYRSNLLYETASAARAFLEKQNTERTLVAAIRLQCFARKLIAIQTATNIRKAVIAIQSWWRGSTLRSKNHDTSGNCSLDEYSDSEECDINALRANIKQLEDETLRLKSHLDILATPKDKVVFQLSEMISSMKTEHQEEMYRLHSERKVLLQTICSMQNQLAAAEKMRQETNGRFYSIEDRLERLRRPAEPSRSSIPSSVYGDWSCNSDGYDDFSDIECMSLLNEEQGLVLHESKLHESKRSTITTFRENCRNIFTWPKFEFPKRSKNVRSIFCSKRYRHFDDESTSFQG